MHRQVRHLEGTKTLFMLYNNNNNKKRLSPICMNDNAPLSEFLLSALPTDLGISDLCKEGDCLKGQGQE